MLLDFKIVELPMKLDPVTNLLVVDIYNPTTFFWRAVIMLGVMIIILPMSLMQDINKLKYFSLGNLVVLIYLIGVTLG
jgi:hypothetical protein